MTDTTDEYTAEQVEALVEMIAAELPEDGSPIDWEWIWDRCDGAPDPTRPQLDPTTGDRHRLFLPSDLNDPIFRTLKRRAKQAQR